MNLSSSWEYISEISRLRLSHNKTERHVAQFGEYIEVIGAAGELAARRFLQLSEKLHTEFDGGADIVWNDIRIDVKATILTRRVLHRFLQWPLTKRIKSDVILLTAVSLEEKSAIIVGWSFPQEILSSPINASRAIPCHEIPVRALHKPDELLQLKTQEVTF